MKRLAIAILALALFASSAFAFENGGSAVPTSGAGSGTVTNVSGTANQVNVANGTTTPVISLIGPYTPATLGAHGILLGEGTSSIVAMAVCGNGSFPYGQNAADPICSTLLLPNAATAGDLLAATSTNTVGSIADVATGQVLASGGVGVVPAYTSAPTIAVTNFTGTFPALNGNALTFTAPQAIGGTTPAAGTFTNINQTNNQGAFTNSQTVTCDMSLGPICRFTFTGTVTVATPTNMVANQPYFIQATSLAANATLTFGSGWITYAPTNGSGNEVGGTNFGTFVVNNNNVARIPFLLDGGGTKAVINTFSPVLAVTNLFSSTFNAASTTLTGGGASGLALTGGTVLSMTGGTAPTLTAGCNGAGSSVNAGSTDNRGQFTTQTAAATGCTLTFNHTWPQAPFCVLTSALPAVVPGTATTTTFPFTFTSTASTVVNYHCE